jgi:F-type H+-transporting ATPase subunit b
LLADVPMQYRAEAWIERIEHHLKALPQGEREALTRQLSDGQSLKVVTAAALPPAMAGQWQERLHRSLGSSGITFEVDPDLIAGAELHFPTAILRFSWQSALLAARTEVSSHARPR